MIQNNSHKVKTLPSHVPYIRSPPHRPTNPTTIQTDDESKLDHNGYSNDNNNNHEEYGVSAYTSPKYTRLKSANHESIKLRRKSYDHATDQYNNNDTNHGQNKTKTHIFSRRPSDHPDHHQNHANHSQNSSLSPQKTSLTPQRRVRSKSKHVMVINRKQTLNQHDRYKTKHRGHSHNEQYHHNNDNQVDGGRVIDHDDNNAKMIHSRSNATHPVTHIPNKSNHHHTNSMNKAKSHQISRSVVSKIKKSPQQLDVEHISKELQNHVFQKENLNAALPRPSQLSRPPPRLRPHNQATPPPPAPPQKQQTLESNS